jgi:hypothetical protein
MSDTPKHHAHSVNTKETHQKKSLFRRYLSHLQHQPQYVQHIHATIFAGTITFFIAILLLQYNYGILNETYQQGDELTVEESIEARSVSPFSMMGSFFIETQTRLEKVKDTTTSFFEGKEVYSHTEDGVGGIEKR